jgi:hypothetical protein
MLSVSRITYHLYTEFAIFLLPVFHTFSDLKKICFDVIHGFIRIVEPIEHFDIV